MKKKESKQEIEISAEEQEMIFKGIRPEGMEYEVFKKVRKDLNKALKLYSGGQFKHVSVNMNPLIQGKVEPKGTYVRTKPKRYVKKT